MGRVAVREALTSLLTTLLDNEKISVETPGIDRPLDITTSQTLYFSGQTKARMSESGRTEKLSGRDSAAPLEKIPGYGEINS